MSCSCSKQIAAGEHLRRGEILLLFGFAPCECVAAPTKSAALREAILNPDAPARLGIRQATWGQVELEVGDWILNGTGNALYVSMQALSIPNQKWRLFSSTNNIRCTNIALDTLGFECTDAVGHVVPTGRRLHLRHINHAAYAFAGTRLRKAWVHESAPKWLRVAETCAAPDGGEVIQWT